MRDSTATQQLLLSDAVDRSVAHIDFSVFKNEKVYLDTRYLADAAQRQGAFVNSNYIISSLRQHLMASGCLIEESADKADYVVEARVGALAADGHDVNYGLQGSGALAAAANVLTGTPALPSLPEISLARKSEDSAVAKISLFAYHRESREPVWQSGTSLATSKAQRRWILGAGPFKSGEVYTDAKTAKNHLQIVPFDRSPNWLQQREQEYKEVNVFDTELRQKMMDNLELTGPDGARIARHDEPPDGNSAPSGESAPTGEQSPPGGSPPPGEAGSETKAANAEGSNAAAQTR